MPGHGLVVVQALAINVPWVHGRRSNPPLLHLSVSIAMLARGHRRWRHHQHPFACSVLQEDGHRPLPRHRWHHVSIVLPVATQVHLEPLRKPHAYPVLWADGLPFQEHHLLVFVIHAMLVLGLASLPLHRVFLVMLELGAHQLAQCLMYAPSVTRVLGRLRWLLHFALFATLELGHHLLV